MSSPRNPRRDLGLEALGDRDGLRPAPLGETAHVAQAHGPVSSVSEFQAAYQALIDAVFTAPGAAEWLFGLRMAVATMFAAKDPPPHAPAFSDAIRTADPGPGSA
jgi:hypothetical protein